MGDSWYRAGEFRKASEGYATARQQLGDDRLMDAGLLLKLSHVEEKLGNYTEALRWTEQARTILNELAGTEAAREMARSSAWYAMLLQAEGRTTEALDWARAHAHRGGSRVRRRGAWRRVFRDGLGVWRARQGGRAGD